MTIDRLTRYSALAASLAGTTAATADVIASDSWTGSLQAGVTDDTVNYDWRAKITAIFAYDSFSLQAQAIASAKNVGGQGWAYLVGYAGPSATTAFNHTGSGWSAAGNLSASGSIMPGSNLSRMFSVDLSNDRTISMTVNYDLSYVIAPGTTTVNFTITGWSYTVEGASTPAVPGLGGIAALACGAAGVRRKRNRVA